MGIPPFTLLYRMGIQRWCASFYNTMRTLFVSKEGSVWLLCINYTATTLGREGLTRPQYEAKTKDYLALLENILSVCSDSITDVTTRNETALHIALKNNNLEAFKFLVGWLIRKWPYWKKILAQKDVEGNTIFHIAVSTNQTQASSLISLVMIFNSKLTSTSNRKSQQTST